MKMKKPVNFQEVIAENKAKYIKVLPYIKSSRKPRSKPRSEEESICLAVATANAVKMAYKSGRIVKKSPKGFVLNESKK